MEREPMAEDHPEGEDQSVENPRGERVIRELYPKLVNPQISEEFAAEHRAYEPPPEPSSEQAEEPTTEPVPTEQSELTEVGQRVTRVLGNIVGDPEVQNFVEQLNSKTTFKELVEFRREFSSVLPTRGRGEPQKARLSEIDHRIDAVMERAHRFGRVAGMEIIVNGTVREVMAIDHPWERLSRIEEELQKLEERNKNGFSEGAYYFERAMVRLRDSLLPPHERILNEEPARQWEWTETFYKTRLIQAEKEKVENAEKRRQEEKEIPRAAALLRFSEIYDTIRDPNNISIYQAALETMAHPESIPEEERESVLRAARQSIEIIPEGQKQILSQAIENQRNDPEQKDLKTHIDLLVEAKHRTIIRAALDVINQEESFPVDRRNNEVLDRAINQVERALPEALESRILGGLNQRMSALYYEEFREKINKGTISLSDDARLLELEKSLKDEESQFWIEFGGDAKTRETWEGIRSFYLKRAFRALRAEFDNRTNWPAVFRREQELIEQLNEQRQRDEGLAERIERGEVGDQEREEIEREGNRLQREAEELFGQFVIGEWSLKAAERYYPNYIEAKRSREQRELQLARIEDQAERKRRMLASRGGLRWERSIYGSVVLNPELINSEDELREAVDQFLAATEGETSEFDANRTLEDMRRLGEQITELGGTISMDLEARKELRSEAEARLLILAANWFIIKGLVEPWGQIMNIFSKHGMERLSAISRAYKGEVMHAAYFLEHVEMFRRQFRPQVDDRMLGDWVAQAAERDRVKNRLIYTIARSRLKRPQELGLADERAVIKRIGVDQSDQAFLNLFSLDGVRVDLEDVKRADESALSDGIINEYLARMKELGKKVEEQRTARFSSGSADGQPVSAEEAEYKKYKDAEQAVNVAIMTLTDFGISAEHGAPSIRTRVEQVDRKGELVSIEDAIRVLKFVRETFGQRQLGNQYKINYNVVVRELEDEQIDNGNIRRRKVTRLETDSERLQRVEDARNDQRKAAAAVMDKALQDIKKDGYDAKFTSLDGTTITLKDILKEEWLDPQYNYYIAFDHKLRKGFFNTQTSTPIYDQNGNPTGRSIPVEDQLARIKRYLEHRGIIRANPGDQTEEQMGLLHAMEAQRRDYFEDDELIYKTFLKDAEDMVHGLTNLPFGLKRIYYPSTAIRFDQENIVIRGKDMLPFLSAQHRNIAREFGTDFRGLVALFERDQGPGAGKEKAEGTIGDSYEIERWVNRAVAAQKMRTFLIGGPMDNKEVRGLMQSPIKDIRNILSFNPNKHSPDETERNTIIEKGFETINDSLSRVLAFCIGFEGTAGKDRVPGIRSAKWAGDKAFDYIINWLLYTEEALRTYPAEVAGLKYIFEFQRDWFMEGRGSKQLLDEIKRREIPPI